MPHAFTLVLNAAPGSGHLNAPIVERVRAIVGGATEPNWLSPGDAWETSFEEGASDRTALEIRAAVEQMLTQLPIDVAVVRSGTDRRKKLLCADMESTIIAQEMLDEMAELVGCRAAIEAITAAAMRGELDFEGALLQRVGLFAGLDVAKLEPLKSRMTLMPGAQDLLATLRDNGCKTALVTGGFTIFAEPIAQRLGFDELVANVLEVQGGRLTGRVAGAIVGPNTKAETLRRLAASQGLDLSQTIAVGDGANDSAMLAAAGLGVAFRAKPILAAQARSSETGAVVRHGDLSALLHLQGYARSAFAHS